MIAVVFFLVFLCPAAVFAADVTHVCPGEITAGWNVSSPPAGWESFGTTTVERHRLSGAAFSDGHPKGQAFLKPYDAGTNSSGNKSVRTNVYRFPGKYPDGIWLVCSYADTSAIVFRRLPSTPKTCEIPYRVDGTRRSIQAIRCQ